MRLLPYKEHGLKDIWLSNGYTTRVNRRGEKIVTIEDHSKLKRVVGLYLCESKKILCGADIQFLRHQIQVTRKELSILIGISYKQITRYERSSTTVSGPCDRLIRILYMEHINEPFLIKEFLSDLADLDSRLSDKQVFRITKDGLWETF